MVRGREPERLSRDDHSGRQGQCGRYRVGFGLPCGRFVDLDFEGPGLALGPSPLSGLGNIRCFGPLLTAASTACSNRSQASGSVSISSGFGFFGDLAMTHIDPETTRNEFILSYTRCLFRWTDIEQELCRLFMKLVRSADERVSSTVFFSVVSFEAKLDMIDAAAQFALSETALRDEWFKLSNKASKRARKRNAIVHCQLIVQSGEYPNWEFRLRPNLLDYRKILAETRGKDWFNAAELNRQTESFEGLAAKIHEFNERATASLASPGKSPQ